MARDGALRQGPLPPPSPRLRRLPRLSRGRRRPAPCLALVLPVTSSVGLKAGILGSASTTGAGAAAFVGASTAASLTGSLSAKLAAGALLVGGGATGGAAIVERADPAPRPAPVAVRAAAQSPVASP